MDRQSADQVVAAIDVERARRAACPVCLFGIARELEAGDEKKIEKALRFFVPLLWDEGLAEPLKAALERAGLAGVPHAGAAIADLKARGPASLVAEALVRRLASEQVAETERTRIASLN